MVTERAILRIFLQSPKRALHLREIARLARLNPNSAFRFLNRLEGEGLLKSERVGPLRRFSLEINERSALKLAEVQVESFLKIAPERRLAIRTFLESLPEQPVFSVLFGSTAKGGARADSDVDILLVFNRPADTREAERKAEAETGIAVGPIQCGYREFLSELKTREDKVIASAVNSGIPLSNHLNYNLLVLSGG